MGENLDTTRIPISDLGLSEENILSDYNAKINSNEYSEAVAVLDNNHLENKGIRAAIINAIKSKILELEIFLLNSNIETSHDTYYSLSEPTDEEIGDKKFWVKVIPN